MPLPLFKLGALLAKQISKPLSKILKSKAQQSVLFRKYFVIPTANAYHNADVTIRMRILGLGSPDKVPPLTEAAAIELGGDILSEFFVFGTAVSLVLIEYLRQSKNQAQKEHSLDQHVAELQVGHQQLKSQLQANNQRIAELSKFVQDQRVKLDEANAKIARLSVPRPRTSTQASQTVPGRQIGKVIVPSSSKGQRASADVTNSVLYQTADDVASQIQLFSIFNPFKSFSTSTLTDTTNTNTNGSNGANPSTNTQATSKNSKETRTKSKSL